MSLVLYGGYLGPKYKLGGFKTANRGYDPTLDFDKFKEKIYSDINRIKSFQKPIYETLLDQRYFNGIGNYLRAEILYRVGDVPFKKGKDYIEDNPTILNLCKDVCEESYQLGGAQLKDWENPFKKDKESFNKWLKCYGKGSKIKDSNNRTFWYDPKFDINYL
jgi:endonuclease VIII-like 1